MKYTIQMQFIPLNNFIWVTQLTPEDPIYEYSDELEADIKANELELNDITGRKYRVISS